MASLFGSGAFGAGPFSGSGSVTYKDLGTGTFTIASGVGVGDFGRLRDLVGSLVALASFSGSFSRLIDLGSGEIDLLVNVVDVSDGNFVSEALWEPDPPCPANVWARDPDIQGAEA